MLPAKMARQPPLCPSRYLATMAPVCTFTLRYGRAAPMSSMMKKVMRVFHRWPNITLAVFSNTRLLCLLLPHQALTHIDALCPVTKPLLISLTLNAIVLRSAVSRPPKAPNPNVLNSAHPTQPAIPISPFLRSSWQVWMVLQAK